MDSRIVKAFQLAGRIYGNVMRGILILGLLIFLVCLSANAQVNMGRILGGVVDQSGGAIVGAAVTVLDTQRGTSRTLTTDDAGEYLAPNLLPGIYKIRVEASGFKTFERDNILIEVGKELRVDAQLQPGTKSEIIVITEEVPMVDTTTSSLGGTISNQTINDLPLNGRNYQNLLQLRPGVTIYPGGGSSTQSTNGIRPEDNVYLLDGQFISEPFNGGSVINGAAIAGDAATILPIDSIQEFNTEQNPKAEFGWKPGAIVNVGMKSGTNSFHGTAYAFGRDDAWDARNFYNTAPTTKAPLSMEQFGATVGGPIIQDKLFFFGGYEGQRYTASNSNIIAAPETSPQAVPDPTNSAPDAIAGVIAVRGVGALSAASLKMLGCSAPTSGTTYTCTGGLFPVNPGSTTSVSTDFPNTNSSNNYLAKADYHLNAKNTVSGMFFGGKDNAVVQDFPYINQIFLSQLQVTSYVGDGSWTWTPNATWANQVRFGYNRFYDAFFPGDHSVNASTYGLDTGVSNPPITGGLPAIYITGFNYMGNGANHPKIIGPDRQWDGADDVTFLRGKHAIKFGGEFREGYVTQGTYRDGRGRINFKPGHGFTPLENFFAGLPQNGQVLDGDPIRNLKQPSVAAFVQDDWRFKQNLTLNLGLRYEYVAPPSESNNLLGNFIPSEGLVQVGKQIGSVYKPDHLNFSPRVGIAWDVTGKGTTVVRAGGSIIYETLTANMLISEQNTQNAPTLGLGVIPTGATITGQGGVVIPSPGNIAVTTLTIPGSQLNWNGTVFPNSTSFTCSVSSPCSILGMDRNFRTPYVSMWTLNIQHALTNKVSLEVAYVGDHGTKLAGITDINALNPQSPGEIACGHCESNANRPYYAQYPYLQFINWLSNRFESNYNGLQATLTARDYHGLTFVLGYTYSHALDQASENWNQYGVQNNYAPGLEYGNSDFDIRHRFTFSASYTIPGKKGFGQMLEGWQINSIVALQTGMPWSALDATTDISATGEFNDHWNFYGNPSDFTSGANPLPYFSGTSNPACAARAAALDGTNPAAPYTASLTSLGCYAKGKSILIPPALGTFGTLGRNVFRDSGFHNWDFSVVKNWRLKERYTAQFRAEFFNILNHPEFANPYGGPSQYGAGLTDDPSQPGLFGCGCATPDVAAANPVIGSGSNRAIQLGMKFIF